MTVSRIWICAFVLVLLGFGRTTHAQNTLTYQGQLFGANGPVSSDYGMTFRLYDSAEGGEALWAESFSQVPVVDGIFIV